LEISRLNEILKIPNLCEIVGKSKIKYSKELIDIIQQTESFRGRAFSTLDYKYQNMIKNLNRLLLGVMLPEITPKHHIQKIFVDSLLNTQKILRYHDSLRETKYEANKRLSLLRDVLTKDRLCGYLSINPAADIEKHPEKQHTLKLDASSLLDKVYPKSEPMLKRAIMLAFHLVQHENEIKNLKWSSFDFEKHIVSFVRKKTGADIAINYSQNEANILL